MTDRTTKRSIAYARVSTAHQSQSGLGIQAQLSKCQSYAEVYDYVPCNPVVDDGISGATDPNTRPGLSQALERLDCGEADVLITSSLSRLGRKTADVLELADRANANGWSLAILDMHLDTNTPQGRFALTILAGVAELEREQIRQRTRDALQAKKAQGVRLGKPVSDQTRKAGIRAHELRNKGHTWKKVAERLTAEGFERAQGSTKWTISTAQRAHKTITLDNQAESNRQTSK